MTSQTPDQDPNRRAWGFTTIAGRRAISMSSLAGTHDPVTAQHPWPADVLLQGGDSGIVLGRSSSYTTAFVEAYSSDLGLVRGEGNTWAEAEDVCWAKATRILTCPGPTGHRWDPRTYRNGAGICALCGRFAADVISAEELGSRCQVCDQPTCWHIDDADQVRCRAHTEHTNSPWCACLRCMPDTTPPPSAAPSAGPESPHPPTP